MRLFHCFMDLVTYVVYFQDKSAKKNLSEETVREEIIKRIEKSRKLFDESGFSYDEYDLARFAVFVWVDESIMQSDWPDKSRWKKRLLQREFYKTSAGGVEFYNRLDSLEPEEKNVREVYYLCLVSGFKGMYGSSGEDAVKRDSIKSKHLKRLTGTSEGPAAHENNMLFGESYGNVSGKVALQAKNTFVSPVSVLIVTSPVIVLVFLFVIYRFILNNEMITKLIH